VTNKLHKKFM